MSSKFWLKKNKVPKYFKSKKNNRAKIFETKKDFWSKDIWVKKNVRSKTFSVERNLGSRKCKPKNFQEFWVKKIQGKKLAQKYLGKKWSKRNFDKIFV